MISIQPLITAALAVSIVALVPAQPVRSQSAGVNLLQVDRGEVKIRKPQVENLPKGNHRRSFASR